MSDAMSQGYKDQCSFEEKAMLKFGHLSKVELENACDKLYRDIQSDEISLKNLEKQIRIKERDCDMLDSVLRLKNKGK